MGGAVFVKDGRGESPVHVALVSELREPTFVVLKTVFPLSSNIQVAIEGIKRGSRIPDSIRDAVILVTQSVLAVGKISLLRSWHSGRAMGNKCLIDMLAHLFSRAMAVTVTNFLCGGCQCSHCARHGRWQTPRVVSSQEPPGATTHNCCHFEAAAQLDDSDGLVEDVKWSQNVELSILAGKHMPELGKILDESKSATKHRYYINEIGGMVCLGLVYILKFNRNPQSMVYALEQGPSLQLCRRELESMGFAWKMKSGAYIFVHPSQYHAVTRALIGRILQKTHVVVSASFEYLLEEALGEVGKGAWVSARQELSLQETSASQIAMSSLPDLPAQPNDINDHVLNTFIHYGRHRLRNRYVFTTHSEPGARRNFRFTFPEETDTEASA